jgi:4-diphosphocytidyl-2-C-methyl-D-erythritol kinase
MTTLEKNSPCKVNLLLNILGKRPDGFHQLETVIQPVNLCDQLRFEQGGRGTALTCSDATLPTDSRNLVHRAATAFLAATEIRDGVKIHLEKQIPLAAGLGGGSGNAATALLGLNELFDSPLSAESLNELAAGLGSDVPFFLQSKPALGTGRGEQIQPLDPFPVLHGKAFFLIHPGFGISTPWAYRSLARFPQALNGQPGRAPQLITKLRAGDLPAAATEFYNSLEAPALEKYPLLGLYQEFLREHGAIATLMSGSGSTTFAIVNEMKAGEVLRENFLMQFGSGCWTALVAIE